MIRGFYKKATFIFHRLKSTIVNVVIVFLRAGVATYFLYIAPNLPMIYRYHHLIDYTYLTIHRSSMVYLFALIDSTYVPIATCYYRSEFFYLSWGSNLCSLAVLGSFGLLNCAIKYYNAV
jgi:hypothetical protein